GPRGGRARAWPSPGAPLSRGSRPANLRGDFRDPARDYCPRPIQGALEQGLWPRASVASRPLVDGRRLDRYRGVEVMEGEHDVGREVNVSRGKFGPCRRPAAQDGHRLGEIHSEAFLDADPAGQIVRFPDPCFQLEVAAVEQVAKERVGLRAAEGGAAA